MADAPVEAPYSMLADYAALAPQAREVLDCWFGAPDTAAYGKEHKRWFSRDEAFDAMLRERFGALIDAANDAADGAVDSATNDATDCTRRGAALDDWRTTPLGALALVIVLDQFSRNCHRNTPRAFAADQKALRLAQRIIASGADRLLPSVHHRAFAYLPFEHDETLASQRESLRLFEQLRAEPGGESYYRSAVRHAEVIERFGRFPHRNAVLGRASSAEETEFLRKPGSSF